MANNSEILKPAIFGGNPIRTKPFPAYPYMGQEEVDAVTEVVKSGNISMFDVDFLGGEKVQTFENNFASYNGVKYGITVNSGTSALHVALAAAGISPGDEVIVPPYTFTATATSVLMNNAVPVFADILPDTYCIDPEDIEKKITNRTKAIIPVHIFGHPAEMDYIMEIARKYDLKVIEDCAQAPGAKYKGKKVGSFGDLAAFSFQRTKNMMTGEGGMVITDNPELAHRCRLIRNHGEAVVKGKKREYLANILGYNFRMTELEAAIGVEQLKKLDSFNKTRINNSEYLTKNLSELEGLITPIRKKNCKHVYGTYVLNFKQETTGISKDQLIGALEKEGIPIWGGYPHPLYKNPIFKEKITYGLSGCPFSCNFYDAEIDYTKISCKVTENICRTVFGFSVIRPPAGYSDMDDIIEATRKIFLNKKYFTN